MPAESAYTVLMRSLNTSSAAPKSKRRKLEHRSEPDEHVEDEHSEAEDAGEDIEELEHEETSGHEEEESANGEDVVIDDEEPEDLADPFEVHFANPDENVLSRRLQALQQNQWMTQKIITPQIGKVVMRIPMTDGLQPTSRLTTVSGPGDLKLKQKLALVMEKRKPQFNALESHLAPFLFGYQDVLYCERTPSNGESLRQLTCLHAINHILKYVPV